jgi:hypothetical protein
MARGDGGEKRCDERRKESLNLVNLDKVAVLGTR